MTSQHQLLGNGYPLSRNLSPRLVTVDALVPLGRETRKHPARQIRKLEEAGPGLPLLQDLRASMPKGLTRPIGIKPVGSKQERMAIPSAKIEAGHIYFPREASWLPDFLIELLSFPNGHHDDQVDSLSQFIN